MYPTTSSLPSLTVVVAAWNSPAHLRACLDSLACEQQRTSFDVIICFPTGLGFEAAIPPGESTVAGVALQGTPTVPTLRKAGLDRARGQVVAFLEDHAQVVPGWARALLAGYEAPLPGVVAVGGPVAQGPGLGLLDWGTYLFDYGRFAPPQPTRHTKELSGLNMSFRRTLLDAARPILVDGVYEASLFAWLNGRRNEMLLASDATVTQNKTYTLRGVVGSVFHLGRGYASRRVRGAGRALRALRASSCVLLPPLLLWKAAAPALRGRNRTAVVLSLGYLSMILVSWSAGEFAGYVAGSGDSDSQWR